MNVTAGNCGAPPSAEIDGLPAATCGSPTFNKALDKAVGYLNFRTDHYSESLESLIPRLGDYPLYSDDAFGA